MAVVIASALDVDIAGTPLLRDVSFKLERRDRMTLSGRNGSGKTTLLRVLAGEASLDGGELAVTKGTRISLHDQRPPRERGVSLRDYVLSGCGELVALEERLTALEQAMAEGATDARTYERYAEAQARLEHAGGYRWRDRVLDVLRGLGFGDDAALDRSLGTFSGGELTRASLARALAGDPDLLLLDEPTNHLDIASLEWLESWLVASDTAVVLVAHDRWFLEAVGTCVLELEAGRSRYFSGAWHAWRKEKAARDLAQGRAIAREQAQIEQLERFVTRFRAGTRARQAQSRVKALGKLERTAASAVDGKSLAFEFVKPQRSGRVVFEMLDGRVEIGDRTLLDGAELWLERGEHVSLIGPNGSGKTTLLSTLTGEREPAGGKLRRGHNVTLGVLSQHAEETGEQGTVLEAAQRATRLPPQKARALLGRFLFSGEDAEKPLDGLSGGERQRLSLAILVSSGANVLVLDEPTNHLDVESREALEDALRSFTGSLLLVSHDRALLDAVGTRTVSVEDGTLRTYTGGWAEYLRVRAEREAQPANSAPKPPEKPKATTRANPKPAGESKNRRRERERLEREIETAETELKALEDELADPGAWTTPERAAEASGRHADARSRVESLYADYEPFAR
jgi:ATP-binding cassette subfamily F protein 3